ncbi:NUDIX hydrolase [Candidatus Woesearchaeota archaeon]|nr:NUDIX hydrolase [Candidatus Woesearchaeota archaeon]
MSDVHESDRPLVTVDIIIFTVRDSDLQVLLVKRNVLPFKDCWALPGGFVRMNESLEDAAKRELMEETGVHDVYLEQLYTFGEPARDPRTRVITVAYFALISSEKLTLKAATDVSAVGWFAIKKLPQLAFDHDKILAYAVKRLRWKLEYTNIVYSLLPDKFTLTNLQNVYEIIIDRQFDKRNFRKKLLSLGLLKDTKEMTQDVSHRPAKLYSFKKRSLEIRAVL